MTNDYRIGELKGGLYAHGVNDLPSLDVFIEEQYLFLNGFLEDFDHHTHRPVREMVVVT
jgi:hypothetical protein